MCEPCYTVGKARRFVAGNIWCAQAKNSGKFPCLRCRGRGTLSGSRESDPRVMCPDCKLKGYSTPEVFFLWMRLWVQLDRKGLSVDGEILHS